MIKNQSILFIIVLVLFMSITYADGGLLLTPGDFNVTNLQPGHNISMNLKIVNSGATTLNINITSVRLLKSENKLLIETGGIANMITVSPSIFTLTPQAEKIVKITVTLTPDYNALDALGGIMVTGIDNQTKGNASVAVKNNIALIVPISVGTPGIANESLTIKPNIQGFLLSSIPGGLTFNINNTGNVKEQIIDTATVSGFLESNRTINVGNSTLYPGDTATISNTWTPGLFDMGFYTIINTGNYGTDGSTQTAVNKQSVFVFPIWLLFLLLISLTVYSIKRSGIKSPIEIKRKK